MDAAEAAEEYATIADRMRTTMPPDHPTLRNVRINWALMLSRSGAFEAAQHAIDELRADEDRSVSGRLGSRSRIDLYEALVRAGLGDLEAARTLARRAHEARRADLGATAWRAQEALAHRVRFDEPDLARTLIDEALVDADPIEDALNPAVMRLHGERARIDGDLAALRRVLARQEELLGRDHEDAVRTRADLAALPAG